jgi:hypothetical protein
MKSSVLSKGTKARRGDARVLLQVQSLEDRLTPATALLPDLIVWADPSQGFLGSAGLDGYTQPGRVLLRFGNAVANIGTGAMELRGGAILPDESQEVFQRIFNSDGSHTDRLAGLFEYHSTHGHIHFEDFATYNLRAITAGNGVGDIVASGGKTSFCLLDSLAYNANLPGAPRNAVYNSCDQVQGISVGWADVYDYSLPDQWIDVTDVAPGEYWLESIADPLNHLLEANEGNNVARVKVTVGTMVDTAGNTLATARDAGELLGTQTFQGYVGQSDTNDYYRFTVSARSSINVQMSGMSADADLQLLNANGTVLASSVRGGSSSESIARTLDAGTYFVRVYPYNTANTNYSLTLSNNSTSSDGAGNSRGSARDVGVLSGSRTFTDFVGQSDTNDYYRFSVTDTTAFSLQLNGLSDNADVQLLNNNGNVVASSTNSGATAESISRSLSAGTYYVRVFNKNNSNTGYTLTLIGATTGTIDGAGNTLATARDIGVIISPQMFNDYVGSNDTNDYYRFAIASRSVFSLQLDGLSADADVQLLDSNGRVIASSTLGGTSAESLSRTLSAGTYFVRVFPYSGSTNYRLTMSRSSA